MTLHEFLEKVIQNLFQPLLLFFYMGFLIPILHVGFDFPHQVYQGLVIFLLVSIGWHGGEELAKLPVSELYQALGFMLVGFVVNFCIGILAYVVLRAVTKLRRIDAATVAAYYGSDSAGTFATCIGALGSLQIGAMALVLGGAQIPYENLGLGKELDARKVEEALADPAIVKRWEQQGIAVAQVRQAVEEGRQYVGAPYMPVMLAVMEIPGCLVGLYLVARLRRTGMDVHGNMKDEPHYDPQLPSSATSNGGSSVHGVDYQPPEVEGNGTEPAKSFSILSPALLHEVFLNTGIYLLFGGIAIGFVGELQGSQAVAKYDPFYVDMFYGALGLYLLEMGLTASKRLSDLKAAGWRFIAFGILAPNVFATIGMLVAHAYSAVTGADFTIGTYMLFAVLCAAASYIAVPAIQRLVIPEASPTLPLAASLGLTFTYNVTIGITVYEVIAKWLATHLHF